MRWAREHGYVVLTQDLDFAQILFANGDTGPSVVLLRMDNEFDSATRDRVCAALSQAESALMAGALLTLSGTRARLRHLPISRDS
jgi:predicted nuclease of predicted toxin-antitoxin system